jgi:hypothetical protein
MSAGTNTHGIKTTAPMAMSPNAPAAHSAIQHSRELVIVGTSDSYP